MSLSQRNKFSVFMSINRRKKEKACENTQRDTNMLPAGDDIKARVCMCVCVCVRVYVCGRHQSFFVKSAGLYFAHTPLRNELTRQRLLTSIELPRFLYRRGWIKISKHHIYIYIRVLVF